MADTAEILRLMRHAADRLAAEETNIRTAYRQRSESYDDTAKAQAMQRLASTMAASTYAQTVLRLVASFMADTESEVADDD